VKSGEDMVVSQYLGFRLGEEEYAVRILRVKEIIAYTPITKVPGMPSVVLGVINLRGKVVPVVSLASKFGLPARPITRWSCIVIVETDLDGESASVGLLADAVSQVLDLSTQDIEPPPAFGARVRVEYLEGLGRIEGGFVLLLDLDRLLSVGELLEATRAAEEAPALSEAEPTAPGGAPTGEPAAGVTERE
jgi:purine-binding chemotaxis protein CheW